MFGWHFLQVGLLGIQQPTVWHCASGCVLVVLGGGGGWRCSRASVTGPCHLHWMLVNKQPTHLHCCSHPMAWASPQHGSYLSANAMHSSTRHATCVQPARAPPTLWRLATDTIPVRICTLQVLCKLQNTSLLLMCQGLINYIGGPPDLHSCQHFKAANSTAP